MLTLMQLKEIMPQAKTQLLEHFLHELNKQLPKNKINTPKRIAAFLAQAAHESGEFRMMTENLFYSTAANIQRTWPKRFLTIKDAEPFTKNPEKLANWVYANRLGNGAAATGDGYRYRGRGIFQITGKANYQTTATALGINLVQMPELLTEPKYAVASACYFWNKEGLNAYADTDDIKQMTKRINGGYIGLESRIIYFTKAKKALGILK
jgi:putative chitinase